MSRKEAADWRRFLPRLLLRTKPRREALCKAGRWALKALVNSGEYFLRERPHRVSGYAAISVMVRPPCPLSTPQQK